MVDLASMASAASAVASVGNMLGIGGGGGDPARDNRRQTIKLIKERGDAVREGARRSGFNPLTYLGATAGTAVGGAVPETPPLASFAAAMNAVADNLTNQQAVENEEERLRQSAEMQLDRLQKEQARKGGAVEVAPATGNVGEKLTPNVLDMGGSPAEGLARRPQAPGLWTEGAIPVVRTDGTRNIVPAKLASRLDLKPWNVWTQGDNEEVYGDEAGQLVGVPRIPGAIQQIEGGIGGYGQDVRESMIDKNAGIGIQYSPAGNVEIHPPKMQSRPEAGWMDDFFK